MAEASAEFYNRFTRFYPIIDIFLRPQKRKFFNLINTYSSGRALEIGVGNGSNLKYYTRHSLTGIDTSVNMLARATKQIKENIQLLHMSGESLAFEPETFDYVILSHVIAVVDNPEKLLNEIRRVLKPSGKIFILNHFTPNNGLKYIDRAFGVISRLFHFRSVFKPSDLRELNKFKLVSERNVGLLSYFKILVYEKSV